jgi:hypothetical protein
MNVSILFYYLPPPNLTVPRTIEYRSPCVPRRSRVLSNPSLDTLTCIWLDVVFFVDLRPHKASVIFFYLFFASYFNGRNDATRPPPSSSPCAPSPPTISHRLGQILVGCCVPPSTGSHRNATPRHSL